MNDLSLPLDLAVWALGFLLPGILLALLLVAGQKLGEKYLPPILWKGLWFLLGIKLLIPLGTWDPLAPVFKTWEAGAWEAFSPLYSRETGNLPQGKALGYAPYLPVTATPQTSQEYSSGEEISGIPTWDLRTILLGFYFVGTVLSLSFFGARVFSARFLVRQASGIPSPEVQLLLDQCRRMLKMKRAVRLLVTSLCPGPAAWGILRPTVLIPPTLSKDLTEDQLRSVFLHELAHLKMHDPLTLFLADLITSLAWFHPALWIMNSRFRTSTEVTCDWTVMKTQAGTTPLEYGRTLLRLLSSQPDGPLLPGARTMASSPKEIKTRIKMIKIFAPKKISLGGAVLLVLLGTGLAAADNLPTLRRMPPVFYDKGSFYRYAEELMDEMQWDKAARIYSALLVINPGEEAAATNLARILMMDKEYEKALVILGDVEKSTPWAWITSAMLKDYLGRREEALEEYSEVLEWRKPQESIRKLALLGLERPLHQVKTLPLSITSEDRILDPSGWRAWANSLFPGYGPQRAIDGDADTRWLSNGPMAPGMEFSLDLGRLETIWKIALIDDAGGKTIFTNDYPRSWRILGSADNQNWTNLSSGTGVPDIYTAGAFPIQEVRYLRFSQDGTTQAELWSIYEIKIWGPVTK